MEIEDLVPADIGAWVEFTKSHQLDPEVGRIKSWNDKFIFVVFKCCNDWDNYMDYTGCSCRPEDLSYPVDIGI